MLSTIYQYADFAYVGGGFGKGIHNILEAAVFGMPIFMGPNNSNFNEAKDLKKLKVAIEIYNSNQMIIKTDIITSNHDISNKIKLQSREYINQNAGATTRILDYLKNNED
jgi:3-deoxy-D-manno-octulosonic-acid transferase